MKKILFTIIGLSALFCMSSCDEAVYKGRKVYKAYFDYTLKDPESFKVYSEKYTKDGDFTVNWELDYGAKNSLGGMVREKATFIVELRNKNGKKDEPELETCFEALYGVLLLRLQKKPISEGTAKAVEAITSFLSMLANYYDKDRKGELKLDE